MKGEEIAAISSLTGLSEASIRGLKGQLVKTGQLPSKASKRAKKSSEPEDEGSDVELVNESDHLQYVLKTCKLPAKDIIGVLELADDYGYTVEGIFDALEDQGIRKAIRKKILTRWSSRTQEEIPQWLEEELSTTRRGSRERGGRGHQYLTQEDLDAHDRKRAEVTRLTRVEEKLDRLLGGGLAGGQPGRFKEIRVPIDHAGNPCPPSEAKSVRYERVPLVGGEGGDVQILRREISDLKEKLFSDQISGLSNQIAELRERGGSDVSAIAGAVKDVLSSWSDSQGGPIVRAANPLVDAFGKKVLENYKGMNSMTPEMRSPEEATPETIISRLRGEGLVSTFRRRGSPR